MKNTGKYINKPIKCEINPTIQSQLYIYCLFNLIGRRLVGRGAYITYFKFIDLERERERESIEAVMACSLDSGWITHTQSCLPIQTGPFFFATVGKRYAHRHYIKSLLISHWRLAATTEVSCPDCLGPLRGTQTELTPWVTTGPWTQWQSG